MGKLADGLAGLRGLCVLTAGTIAVVVSFTALPWRHRPTGRGTAVVGFDFSGLRGDVAHFPAAGRPAPVVAYFTWLGWALLAALVVCGVAANWPGGLGQLSRLGRWSEAMRAAGFLLGLVGAAVTYYALTRYAQAVHDLFGADGGALDAAESGVWCALGGYLVAGAGAMLGPRARPVRNER